jgi:hypothetical protein
MDVLLSTSLIADHRDAIDVRLRRARMVIEREHKVPRARLDRLPANRTQEGIAEKHEPT